MTVPDRTKVISLTREQLIELANHQFGANRYTDWKRGTMLRGDNIWGVTLIPGDVVLYKLGIGRAAMIWTPLIPRERSILPASHIKIDPADIEV